MFNVGPLFNAVIRLNICAVFNVVNMFNVDVPFDVLTMFNWVRVLNGIVMFNGIVMCDVIMRAAPLDHIVEGRGMRVEGDGLACEPTRVDTEHGREESFDLRARTRLAVDVLADVAAAELDAVLLGGLHEIALPYVAQFHRLIETMGEAILHLKLLPTGVQRKTERQSSTR
ncbi:hypothetical protein [uncultured Bifidobacterium sp.]|uniref:hypothetical protein n=1 Tax=uncultured Bifidobacterium sp. TaxID=165187 RepID=UPI002594E2E3|nr:hypothetical protein [uncultured Bifidobacterium sp.]